MVYLNLIGKKLKDYIVLFFLNFISKIFVIEHKASNKMITKFQIFYVLLFYAITKGNFFSCKVSSKDSKGSRPFRVLS
jgi:hypothetical protein